VAGADSEADGSSESALSQPPGRPGAL